MLLLSRSKSQAKGSGNGLYNGINGLLFGFLLGLFLIPAITLANPTGGVITGGSAQISTSSANTVQINQTSDKAMINWQSFNVGSHETVKFQQPSASSMTLNRVNPENGVSSIYGKVQANGRIIISNPAGIWFGPTARVDVAGLIATTAGINDTDFLAGRYSFQQVPGWYGSVINEGIIVTSQAGLVALVGSGVVNNGYIEANLGNVVLASGNSYTIHFSGNSLIEFAVDSEIVGPALDQHGEVLSSAITNAGVIKADGGKVLMTAHTVSDVLDHTINNTGVVEVKSVAMKNGEIILDGGNGLVEVSGQLVASGSEQNQTGGNISVTGKVVALTGNAEVDVSGDQGGGAVLIGGGAHGEGELSNANYVYMGSNATINADAVTQGNGGTVVLWSDLGTKFYGNITARGGSISGNGGWVETSGKAYLDAMGLVTASASNGTAGSWLLDPSNVTISTATTNNGSFDGGSPNEFTTTANNARANVDTINASLNAGTSVTILTTPGGGQAGNITVTDAISKTSGAEATLTLDAVGTINVNADIISTSDALNVILTALNDIQVGVNGTATITTNGGDFTADAANDFIMSNGTGTNVGTINAGAGKVNIAANTDAAGGQDFNMRTNSSISTTSSASDAILVSVNTASGGTGSAILNSMTTGDGGGITVQTDTGGNITGTDITYSAGTLDVGTGTITLTTPQNTGNNIGTSGSPVQISAGTINGITGAAGFFVTNIGTDSLSLGSIDVTDELVLTSTSSAGIIDSGPVTVPGVLTITAGTSQDITLNAVGNDITTLEIISGNNVTIVDANGISFDTSTISGDLDVTTSTGNITQANDITVTGNVTLAAGSNDIVLDDQNNNFTQVTITSANNATIRVTEGLEIGNATATTSLSFTADEAITQAASTTIIVPTLTVVTRNASGAAITLDNTGNDADTIDIGSRNNTGGSIAPGAITYRDLDGFDILAADSSSTVTLIGGGAITQSASIDGGTLIVKTLNDSGAAITLGDSSNDFDTITLQTRNAADTADVGGAILFRDTDAVDIANVQTSSTFTLQAHGAITQSGAMTIGGVATFTGTSGTTDFFLASAANDLSLTPVFNASGGSLRDIELRNISATATFPTLPTGLRNLTLIYDNTAIDLTALTLTGTLSLTAGGDVTQSGTVSVNGNSTFNVGSSNDVTLEDASNDFNTILITAANNVSLVDVDNINFGVSNVSGTLDVVSGNTISDSGTMSVTGVATFDAGLTRNIILDEAANDFSTIVIVAGNTVTLADANDLDMGASTVNGNLTVTTGGVFSDSGNITVNGGNGLTTTTVGGMVLDSAGNQIPELDLTNTGGGDISLVTTTSLQINAYSATGASETVFTTSGTFDVQNGVTITTNDEQLTISANDLDLSGSGALNSGTGQLSINEITASGSIGLGDTAGTMTISPAELQRISTNQLSLITSSNGSIVVDGISATNSANVTEVVLDATAGTLGEITFENNPSTLNALNVKADNGVIVSVDVTTVSGSLVINADMDGSPATSDALQLSADLTSATTMSLSASTGGILLNGDVALTSNGNMTINDDINGLSSVSLDSGSSGNINILGAVGNDTRLDNITIVNANNVTANQSISADTFDQLNGSGVTTFSGSGLNLIGNQSIKTNRFVGRIDVNRLTIDLTTGQITGAIDGSAGVSGILKITVLNKLYPKTIYFNGIDIYLVFFPNVSPENTNYYTINPLLSSLPTGVTMRGDEEFLTLLKKISDGCVALGDNIELCGDWS